MDSIWISTWNPRCPLLIIVTKWHLEKWSASFSLFFCSFFHSLSLSVSAVDVAVYGVAVVVQSSRCWWWSSAGAVFRRMHACPVSVCVPVLGGPSLHKVQAFDFWWLNLSFLNCVCACLFPSLLYLECFISFGKYMHGLVSTHPPKLFF